MVKRKGSKKVFQKDSSQKGIFKKKTHTLKNSGNFRVCVKILKSGFGQERF